MQWQTAINIGVWIIGIALGVALTIALTEPVHWVLANTLSGIIPSPPRNVKGVWLIRYDYKEAGQHQEQLHLVELRQIGGFVIGRTVREEKHKFRIVGRLRQEKYLSGTWISTLPKSIFHGTLHGILMPDGLTINSKWLGFSKSTHTVNHGDWNWELLSHRIGRKGIAQAKRRM